MSAVQAPPLNLSFAATFLVLLSAFLNARADSLPPAPPALEASRGMPPAPGSLLSSPPPFVSTKFGISHQVNVNAIGQNMVGDAANEPSLCIDPTNPNRIAVGWRQFNSTNSDFREAGWGFSTNGGLNWKYGGVLETNVFRSDPVLAAAADGKFYYLSLTPSPVFECDLWRSTNGGASWQRVGPAKGGDKAWMNIDATSSPGRGNIYQAWSTAGNVYSNRTFSFTYDGGLNWADPLHVPQIPVWGTL